MNRRILVVAALLLFFCGFASPQATGTCKSGANILVYGLLTSRGQIDTSNAWAAWLRTVVPSSNVTVDNVAAPVTATSWSQYDLVITAYLLRRGAFSAAEAQNVATYLNNGGALITLAGFSNDLADINRQQSPLAAFGITFGPVSASITYSPGIMVFNPVNPLAAGLQGKWLSYAGGWPSSRYANGMLLAQMGLPATQTWDLRKLTGNIGQTIILPSGGKILAWGDEWVTFLDQYSMTNNGNEQFWKNAVSWVSGICTTPTPVVCGPVKTVGGTCTSAAYSATGKVGTLSFSTATSSCI